MAQDQAVKPASGGQTLQALPLVGARSQINWRAVFLTAVSPWHLVVTALFIGSMLRMWRLNDIGYNSDEAVYAGQAGALVSDPNISPYFPLVRAHPMLFQFFLALTFTNGVNDLAGRLLSMAFGVATVFLVYLVGRTLYNGWTGAIAALFFALMPYHVVVTRQVLLDGPLVFFTTLTLFLVARYALTHSSAWLWAAGAGMGLTFLAKETGIILVGSVFAFLALCEAIPVRIRDIFIASAIMVTLVVSFPLSLWAAGGGASEKAQGYLIWQLLRQPNHKWDFYPLVVPPAIGFLVLLTAGAGLWWLRGTHSWRENLLISWIVVPIVFFQLWPVKGFQYLLPAAPCFALLAGRFITGWTPPAWKTGFRRRLAPLLPTLLATAIVVSLAIPSWNRVETVPSDKLLAGSGGMPGGRETGDWIQANAPEGAVFLCIGPSMANVVQFYGHRRAYGLSVSPNPLTRNPSYQPIHNPDRSIRTGELHYLVYDVYSASRSSHFGDRILDFAEKYRGRIVHIEYVSVPNEEGQIEMKPIIIIFEVRP